MTRQQFYKTRAWKDTRQQIIIRQGGICCRCKKRPAVYVHHTVYLTDSNFNDPTIALNPDNLEGLCMTCHNEEHNPSSSHRNDVLFDANGDLISRY